jgi:hypothetical protein
MAKTVVAMLVGIALAEGSIGSVDDLAKQYVPALQGHPYGETSLRHLLTMSSGVAFREEYDGEDDIATLVGKTFGKQGPGGVDTVLSFRKRDIDPGTRFATLGRHRSWLVRAAVGMPLGLPVAADLAAGGQRRIPPGWSTPAASRPATSASTRPCAMGASACCSRTTAR